EGIIDGREIVVLLFIKNHEAVVLLHQVVVSPERRNEEEREADSRQNQYRADDKEQQRTKQQTLARLPFRPSEVGAREGAKDVWCVDQDGPARDHRNQWQHPGGIERQQEIT